MKFREFIQEYVVVTDGAMGTYYGSLFSHEDILVEKENERHPERIKQIHKEYMKAGANLLRTNTFATNAGFFDTTEQMCENIRCACTLAKEAVTEAGVPQSVFIAADIGTIYDLTGQEPAVVLENYQRMIDTFLEQGMEIFWLETQSDLNYIKELCQYIRMKSSDAFVMVSFSFDKTGYTKGGIGILRMMEKMCAMNEVDAYGLNCGMEAAHMYQLLEPLGFPGNKPFFVLPNAGYPFVLRGKTIYGKNEAYFLEMEEKLLTLGVDMVGGCCGTTPDYIAGTAALVAKAQMEQKDRPAKRLRKTDVSPRIIENNIPEKETFSDKLSRGQRVFVVELDPPSDAECTKLFQGATLLREHGVDLLTLSDSPMARARMDASLLAAALSRETGIRVMPHVCCRDRNVISLRGTLLGDYVNDIRQFLIVTGDPVPKYDRSSITQVFDYNSIKLMGLLKEMNREHFAADPVQYGGALNYHGSNEDAIARRMEQKMEQGCSFFLTQPVYSDEDVERLRELKMRTGAKIFGGIMPLVSRRNACFIANEMPGMHVPAEIIEAYGENMSREEAEDVAVEISLSIAKKLLPVTDGFYFMTPFNRVALICRIIEEIRKL